MWLRSLPPLIHRSVCSVFTFKSQYAHTQHAYCYVRIFTQSKLYASYILSPQIWNRPYISWFLSPFECCYKILDILWQLNRHILKHVISARIKFQYGARAKVSTFDSLDDLPVLPNTLSVSDMWYDFLGTRQHPIYDVLSNMLVGMILRVEWLATEDRGLIPNWRKYFSLCNISKPPLKPILSHRNGCQGNLPDCRVAGMSNWPSISIKDLSYECMKCSYALPWLKHRNCSAQYSVNRTGLEAFTECLDQNVSLCTCLLPRILTCVSETGHRQIFC